MRKSAVVSWYLEQLVSQGAIEDEDELLQRKTLVEKVIDRLMYHVSQTMCLLEGVKSYVALGADTLCRIKLLDGFAWIRANHIPELVSNRMLSR